MIGLRRIKFIILYFVKFLLSRGPRFNVQTPSCLCFRKRITFVQFSHNQYLVNERVVIQVNIGFAVFFFIIIVLKHKRINLFIWIFQSDAELYFIMFYYFTLKQSTIDWKYLLTWITMQTYYMILYNDLAFILRRVFTMMIKINS